MAISSSGILAIVLISSSLLAFATAGRLDRFKALVNSQGPYFGLISSFSTEDTAFLEMCAFESNSVLPHVDLSGRRYRIGTIMGKNVVYVSCGVGMVNAAAATQQMLDMFDIKGVIHFGIAGNVNSSMSIGDVSIPSEFANTGIWDWLNSDGTLPSNDVAQLSFGSFNIPKGDNKLGHVGFTPEQFYDSKIPNVVKEKLWHATSEELLETASKLQGLQLEKCVNPYICLEHEPKVVVGLKGSSSNFFVGNAAYREFIFDTFQVSTADMESSAVVMTSVSNGCPVIVILGLSNLAGAENGDNVINQFGDLAATNAAKVVVEFIKTSSLDAPTWRSF